MRAGILVDIVVYPEGLPRVIVRERTFKPSERLRDYPDKFDGSTAEARELFDQNGLFPEAAWQRLYQSVEKTARIREIESMPRPNAQE